jgi:hypothetical protein
VDAANDRIRGVERAASVALAVAREMPTAGLPEELTEKRAAAA